MTLPKHIDGLDVFKFLNRMDSDLREAEDMSRTEENLITAVREYERVWKVKLKLHSEPAT